MSNTLTCVYCGQALPRGHPAARCPNPEADRNRLRAALATLVGVDGREDLEKMEAVIRLQPLPMEDKAGIIDAIHTLRATLPA